MRTMNLAGHFWTVWPILMHRLRPRQPPPSRSLSFPVQDPNLGRVDLSAQLSGPESGPLILLIHGLGGCSESRYMIAAARVADAMGLACLRLNLRGSDRRGGDLYHAGLSGDLATVLESPELQAFDSVYAMGFSLGGHLVLRLATEVAGPRLGAVAAVCPPLDLALSVRFFDRADRAVYRRYVLGGLSDIYREVAARRELPMAAAEARKIRLLQEWDRQTVVPRFGFASTEDYYRQSSVGRRIQDLKVPSLLVVTTADPMVPPEVCVRPSLERIPEGLDLRWLGIGGHNFFPKSLDLGEDGPKGIEGQAISWMLRQ